jgi:shikimate kinase
MSVVLIGYRGSGKTTIGKRLADRLWQKFVDVDDIIVRMAGKSITRIFAEDGEPHYRDIESAALKEALTLPDHVVALGGGTCGREENRRMIKESGRKVIYLKCDPEVLLARAQADPRSAETRPPLTHLDGGIEEIHYLLEKREPLYREVKTGEIDVTNLTPDEAMVYIARLM